MPLKNEAWSFFNVLIWASLITNGNKSIFTFLLVIEVFSWMNSLFVTFGYFYIAQFAVGEVHSLHANAWFATHRLLDLPSGVDSDLLEWSKESITHSQVDYDGWGLGSYRIHLIKLRLQL